MWARRMPGTGMEMPLGQGIVTCWWHPGEASSVPVEPESYFFDLVTEKSQGAMI